MQRTSRCSLGWKITCPVCNRDFPSNDFESYVARSKNAALADLNDAIMKVATSARAYLIAQNQG